MRKDEQQKFIKALALLVQGGSFMPLGLEVKYVSGFGDGIHDFYSKNIEYGTFGVYSAGRKLYKLLVAAHFAHTSTEDPFG